ncbi:hypothetical protein [Neorhodopirellula lusitana]|uniref:hypothetical protein n=1 Tax=Neorhodopirellula lusitana TaxID=445327 RepID=UPI0024B7BC16|nr:hypothetical protein [Neorhodopirellula lusitana]
MTTSATSKPDTHDSDDARWDNRWALVLFSRGGARALLLGLLMVLVVGCGEPEEAPKASHFEDDHAVAAHWPADLPDLSSKLRERLNQPRMDATSLAEIKDLVSWTAEIAADTNLREDDWVPLHEAAENLTADLRTAKIAPLPNSDLAANPGPDSESPDAPNSKPASSLSDNLRNGNSLNADLMEQLRELCQLIDQSASKIPDELSSFQKTES